MKLILILYILCLSSLSQSKVNTLDPILRSQLETIYNYNHLRNNVAPQIPELNKQEMDSLLNASKVLKEKMISFPLVFDKKELTKMDEFIKQLETSKRISGDLERCELDPEFNLVKNEISGFSDIASMGEVKVHCRKSDIQKHKFPELNGIKDVGIFLSQQQMAREIHEASMKDNIHLYFTTLSQFGSEQKSLKSILKTLCGKRKNKCTKDHIQMITDGYKNSKPSVNLSSLKREEKLKIVDSINKDIVNLNKTLLKLKKLTKKNNSLLTVGGNDFLLNCSDPSSEDLKVYKEYQRQVENFISPNSKKRDQYSEIKSGLVVTMLYENIEKPVKPEESCSESGFQEITINQNHHKPISLENLSLASMKIVRNTVKNIERERSDYAKGDDPIDYIGSKSYFTPHIVGQYLAQNPEATQLVCDGLTDYQSDEKFKKRVHDGVMVLTTLTAFTGIGGLGFMALRAAVWGVGKTVGFQSIRRISSSGTTRFLKRNSNRLLNSKGAIISYGAVTAGEVGTLQYLRKDKQDQIRELESYIMKLPSSSSKEKLLEEYNKLSELNFDFYLTAGLGVLDISSVMSMIKLNKSMNEKQIETLANHLKEKRLQLEKIKDDPNYSPLLSLKYLLPEDEYKNLISDLSANLSPSEVDSFANNFRLNIEMDNGDFLTALRNTIEQNKIDIKVPAGSELNQRILSELSDNDRTELTILFSEKYEDTFSQLKESNNNTIEDLVSIVYLLEKNENLTNRNLPVEVEKEVISRRLAELLNSKVCK